MSLRRELRVELNPAALVLLKEYLQAFPEVRAAEAREHGLDPLQSCTKFFVSELQEPEHFLILEAVKHSNGQVTPLIVSFWREQNQQELIMCQHGLLPDKFRQEEEQEEEEEEEEATS